MWVFGDDKEDDGNDNVKVFSTNIGGFVKLDELDDSSDIDKDDNNDDKHNDEGDHTIFLIV